MHRNLNNVSNTCPCEAGYLDIGITQCYLCESYISGCYTCSSTTLCTACNAGFTITHSGVCQCTSGFLVTGVCTSVYGCTVASNLAGTIFCTACDSTLFYEYDNNYSCICMSGYTQDANGNCNPTCGDSLLGSG